jgi:hypothetical protein
LAVRGSEVTGYVRVNACRKTVSVIVSNPVLGDLNGLTAEVRADIGFSQGEVAAAATVKSGSGISGGRALARYRFDGSDAEVLVGWRAVDEFTAQLKLPSGLVRGADARLSTGWRDGKFVGAGIGVVLEA